MVLENRVYLFKIKIIELYFGLLGPFLDTSNIIEAAPCMYYIYNHI